MRPCEVVDSHSLTQITLGIAQIEAALMHCFRKGSLCLIRDRFKAAV